MKTKPNETCRAKKKKSDMKNSLYRINSRLDTAGKSQ